MDDIMLSLEFVSLLRLESLKRRDWMKTTTTFLVLAQCAVALVTARAQTNPPQFLATKAEGDGAIQLGGKANQTRFTRSSTPPNC
jgi:hypothetical protein